MTEASTEPRIATDATHGEAARADARHVRLDVRIGVHDAGRLLLPRDHGREGDALRAFDSLPGERGSRNAGRSSEALSPRLRGPPDPRVLSGQAERVRSAGSLEDEDDFLFRQMNRMSVEDGCLEVERRSLFEEVPRPGALALSERGDDDKAAHQSESTHS